MNADSSNTHAPAIDSDRQSGSVDFADPRVQAFGLFLEAHASLTGTLESGLKADDVGLSLAEVEVLIELDRVPGEAVRPRDLADRCVMTSSACSRLIQRLEKQQLVGRVRSRSDGRGFDIHLTGRGQAVLAHLLPGLNRRLDQHFSGILTDAELNAFRSTLTKIARANRSSVARGHI